MSDAVNPQKVSSAEEELKKAHILIVDDEKALVDLVREYLHSEGFKKTHAAYNGEEALEVLDAFGEEISVVTLGLMMPRMGGLEAMRILADRHQHVVAIIALTGGGATLENAIKFKELGTKKVIAFDFLSKPFDWDVLLKCIKGAIAEVQERRKQSKARIV